MAESLFQTTLGNSLLLYLQLTNFLKRTNLLLNSFEFSYFTKCKFMTYPGLVQSLFYQQKQRYPPLNRNNKNAAF